MNGTAWRDWQTELRQERLKLIQPMVPPDEVPGFNWKLALTAIIVFSIWTLAGLTLYHKVKGEHKAPVSVSAGVRV